MSLVTSRLSTAFSLRARNRALLLRGQQTRRSDLPWPTAAGVVRGRTVSCYPAVGPDITVAGGTYAGIKVTEAVTDGKLVTAPAWPAHPAWIEQCLKVLGTQISG